MMLKTSRAPSTPSDDDEDHDDVIRPRDDSFLEKAGEIPSSFPLTLFFFVFFLTPEKAEADQQCKSNQVLTC